MDNKLFVLVCLCLSLTRVKVKSELSKINEISKKLDELLVDVDYSENLFENHERKLEDWQKYEFGTGAGNREELRIKNISTKIDPRLKSNVNDYQFVENDGEFFLAGSSDRVFHFYKFDFEQARTTSRIDVNSSGIIRNFVLFVVPNSTEIEPAAESSIILAILSVESQQGSDLIWYRFAQNKLMYLDSWPVREYRVEKLQFFHHEGQNRLLILREEILSLGNVFTPIDIYGFDVYGERPNLWVVQRLNVPKSFDINVCPSYENTIITSRRKNSVVTYEYEVNENGEGLFQERQNVTSNYLHNYVCFESGYIRYLVTSGPEAALFDFFESQFQHDSHSERIFNKIGEISWVESMLVENYRKESILLVQLKNASVVVLSWQGQEFEQVSLPNLELENVDLSRITVIPKYGFINGNKLVKIETELVEKTRPVRDEMEKVFRTKYALTEILHKQRIILDETEARRKKSFFENPHVTGFWNFSKIEVESLTIGTGVSHDQFAVGRKKMKLDDFLKDEKEENEKFNDLESKIQEIKVNLKNSIPIGTPEVTFVGDLLINGSLDVRGTMFAGTLTYDRLNGLSRDEIVGNFSNFEENSKIEGEKILESIDAENLNVFFVNGRPMEEFEFDRIRKHDYSKVDFSKLNKIRIQGNLNFSSFNGVNWDELMGKVILKSQSPMVPGTTTVEGDLVADKIEIERFNELVYPADYILVKNRDSVTMEGKKKVEKLTIGSLDVNEIETINNVPITEFVTANGDVYLPEETTFENLKITENFQIDGNVSGLPDDYKATRLTLRDSLNVTANISVAKLTILGDVEVENSLGDTTWSELEDLVKIDEEKVEITGKKIFLADVQVAGDLIIDKRIINGRSIDEFVTLDTDQEFPYLEKISGNVSFDNVQRDDLEDLKKIVSEDREESEGSKCLRKLLVFKVAPIVDEIYFEAVNNDITPLKFMAAMNRTFANVSFQHLDVVNLRGGEFVPIRVNDDNFEEFKTSRISKTKSQELSGFHEVVRLETNFLHVRTIDGFLPNDLESFRIALDDFEGRISSGNVSVELLEVRGNVNATKINGNALETFYDPRKIATAIFSSDLHVENLMVDGSVNGIHFLNFVNDSVMKNDRNIVIDGKKSFNTVVCQSLQAKKLNGKSVDLLLDRNKHQIVEASIFVNGSAKVLEKFETDGKIGGISWPEIRDKVKFVGNETYVTIGNISFPNDDVKIENLFVTDKIQNVDIADFQKSLIHKNSKNFTIYGPVIFKNRVTIDARFVVTETFNDLDLKNFYEKAVLIDRPLKVKSKILFTKNLHAEKDLLVTDELRAKTVGKIDLKKTYENAAFVDRPVSIPGSVSISNAIFDSDIEVEILNGIDLKSVMTLEGEQIFDRALNCGNITVGKLDVVGLLNGLGLNAIYENTLMLSGNQNISAHLIFDGNVLVRNDFEPIRLNGMDPGKIISLDGNDTLIGNFIFEQPLVVRDNLEVKGRINGIDLSEWQATGVTKTFPVKQTVRGAWTVNGNVHFDKNVYGNDYLDGTNVTKLVQDLLKREPRMDLMMETVKEDLRSFCEDLGVLKKAAENQVYKYEYFDYLEIMNFDDKITSLHHVESEDFDYLLINFESCHLDVFVFTGTEFSRVASLSNVGHMERWFTFEYEKEIFFLTVGKKACGKNEGNLWKFEGDRFTFLEDLGNVTDARKIEELEFLVIVNDRMIRRSIVEIHRNSSNEPKSYAIGNADAKFVVDSNDLLLVNRDTIEEYKLENGIEKKSVSNFFGTDNILSFRLGIYGRELFVYFDDKVSDNYLFISENNFNGHKILQTIDVRRASSIVVVDFDGGIENLLIFIDDEKILQIYEYRGIQNFVYRESIKMKADQIFPFKIRRYWKFSKKRCIAVVHDKKLVIMEAKMQGEKLDVKNLDCDY